MLQAVKDAIKHTPTPDETADGGGAADSLSGIAIDSDSDSSFAGGGEIAAAAATEVWNLDDAIRGLRANTVEEIQ